jgi:hypothetical protein
MQMERDGEDLCRDLAGRTLNKGLRSILIMLAFLYSSGLICTDI